MYFLLISVFYQFQLTDRASMLPQVILDATNRKIENGLPQKNALCHPKVKENYDHGLLPK